MATVDLAAAGADEIEFCATGLFGVVELLAEPAVHAGGREAEVMGEVVAGPVEEGEVRDVVLQTSFSDPSGHGGVEQASELLARFKGAIDVPKE